MQTMTKEKRAVQFINWTQEDWKGVYDGVSYPFKATFIKKTPTILGVAGQIKSFCGSHLGRGHVHV
jgi:hypothetical protein